MHAIVYVLHPMCERVHAFGSEFTEHVLTAIALKSSLRRGQQTIGCLPSELSPDVCGRLFRNVYDQASDRSTDSAQYGHLRPPHDPEATRQERAVG